MFLYYIALVLLIMRCVITSVYMCKICVNSGCDVTDSCVHDCQTESSTFHDLCEGSCQNDCEFCHENLTVCLVCTSGRYGSLCEKICRDLCQDWRCNKQSGFCQSGGTDTTIPKTAQSKADDKQELAENMWRTIFTWTAGTIIVVVVSMVIIMIIIVKCETKPPQNKFVSVTIEEIEINADDDIDEIEV